MTIARFLAAIALLAGGAALALQGPLPGDAGLTLALQEVFGADPLWARWLTDTAKAPVLWATLALAGMLAWRIGGSRGALAVPLAYGLAFVTDKALRTVLFVPRPDPTMVAVAEPAASSGLPSTFGLVYGAIFGIALLAPGPARRARPVRLAAAALLIAGAAARIVAGGHWGSQMVASLASGLLLALAATTITARLRVRRRSG